MEQNGQTQEQPGSPLAQLSTKHIVVEHEGTKVELNVYPAVRIFRNQALEIASIAYYHEFKGKVSDEDAHSGFLPSVFEYEMACRLIKGWNMTRLGDKTITLPNPRIGWYQLEDVELGDKISEAIGVKKVLQSLGTSLSKEKLAAKNSSGGEQPVQSPPSSPAT